MPGTVVAQISDDQVPDQYSKPSAGIPMQGPNDQDSMDQDSMDQGSNDQGSNDQGSMNQGPTEPGSNDQGSGSQTASAPAETNGVARVSLIHGDVSTQRGDNGAWSAAALNAPVLAGDRVSTGDKARTELQLDYANMLRLAEHSQANINTLTRSQIQIQLGRGMANYSVFKNSDADAEIDTPNVAIRTERRESSFRILVTADDHTEVLVRKGEVEVTTPQGGTRVDRTSSLPFRARAIRRNTRSAKHRPGMTGTSGTPIATTSSATRYRGGTPTTTTSEPKISTTTAPGRKFRITVQCGGQRKPTRTGLRIAMATGCTSLIGDGPGFRTMTGAGRRITTAAGCMLTEVGDGGPVRLTDIRSTVRSGRRLMFRSSDAAAVSDLDSAWRLGFDRLASSWTV